MSFALSLALPITCVFAKLLVQFYIDYQYKYVPAIFYKFNKIIAGCTKKYKLNMFIPVFNWA